MPVFTAIAAGVTAVAAAVGFGATVAAGIGAVAAFAARTMLTIGISKLLSKRSGSDTPGAGDSGARVQLPPATDNKLPVIYGTAYIAPVITDAKISSDQKTMWYVCALSEVTDTGAMSFGDIYYDTKKVTFGTGADAAKVVSLTTNSDPVQTDTNIAGNLYIYKFTNGSSSGVNTGGQTAIQILQDSGIPEAQRWTSTDLMSNCAFMIVKVNYNQDAGTTNLGQLNVQLSNSLVKPGAVLFDYFTNARYGCAIPAGRVDTTSLAALDAYSDELITYTPVGGGSSTQPRYRINGPINTGNSCLTNIQQIIDCCDSWLQYSELTGKWKVVINQAYTDYTTLGNLFSINSSNLIGGIDVNPIDLNSTYNSLEVQYPNTNIKDQTDFGVIELIDYQPELLSPNEPANRLVVQLPQVNNYIQAAYLGVRRLLQSREDLAISFATDYSGIQVEAGDVVKVTHAEYGWIDKLYRVSQVQEAKLEDGTLGTRISAFEYNGTVYEDNPLQDFIPEDNTGLSDPNIICQPVDPTVNTTPLTDGTVASFQVIGTIPPCGAILYMDFNYGTSTDASTHKLYKTVSKGNGAPYAAGDNITVTVTDLPPDTYHWSVTARNNNAGRSSSGTPTGYSWAGPNVTTYNTGSGTGGIAGSNIQNNAISIAQMGPGASGFYQATRYDPRSVGGGANIVSVTTTSTRNIPLTYPGVTVPANELNSYYSGTWPYTWTSAPSGGGTYYNNNYQQSSAGTDANFAGIGWYKVISTDLSSDTLLPSEWAVLTGQINFITDTPNTRIQLCRFASFSPGQYNFQLRTLQDVTLTEVGPYTYRVPIVDGSTGSTGTIYEYGWFVRNVTPGSTITAVHGTLTVKQNK